MGDFNFGYRSEASSNGVTSSTYIVCLRDESCIPPPPPPCVAIHHAPR
eukprot:gene49960-45948_t